MNARLKHRLQRVCESFYDIGYGPDKWPPILASLAECFHGVGCDLHILRGNEESINCIGGQPPEVIGEYLEQFIHREPRSLFLARSKEGAVGTDLQFASAEVMQRSEYYADFLPKNGMGSCVAAVPLKSPECVVYFGLHLPRRSPPPSIEMIRSVSFVLPHLNRSIRSQQFQSRENWKESLYREAFNSLHLGAFVICERGTIVSMNRIGEAMIRSGKVLMVEGGVLKTAVASEGPVFHRAVRSACNRTESLGGTFEISGTNGERFKLTIAPTPESLRATSPAASFVFAASSATASEDCAAILHRNHQLSSTETRVALLLADGHTLREIANQLHMTYESVRSVLKMIYSKTGVGRQAALVSMINRYR